MRHPQKLLWAHLLLVRPFAVVFLTKAYDVKDYIVLLKRKDHSRIHTGHSAKLEYEVVRSIAPSVVPIYVYS